MTIGDLPESEADLEREIAGHLARAGIALPDGRMAEVVREYRALKQQIATVRAACPPEAEPATIFQAGPVSEPSRGHSKPEG
jgi:hypothetical protein